MPYYKGLFDSFPKGEDTPARRRAAAGLMSLRRRLREEGEGKQIIIILKTCTLELSHDPC